MRASPPPAWPSATTEREQSTGHQAGQNDHGRHHDDSLVPSPPHRTLRAALSRAVRGLRGRTSSFTILRGSTGLPQGQKSRRSQPLVTTAVHAVSAPCDSRNRGRCVGGPGVRAGCRAGGLIQRLCGVLFPASVPAHVNRWVLPGLTIRWLWGRAQIAAGVHTGDHACPL